MGAQIPIGEVFNDAKNNLIASLCVAGQCQICEVCLMFNNKLLRGNRSTKFDAWHQDAFTSPNFPALGVFGIELEMEEEHFIAAPKKRFKTHLKLFNNIIVIWLFLDLTVNYYAVWSNLTMRLLSFYHFMVLVMAQQQKNYTIYCLMQRINSKKKLF